MDNEMTLRCKAIKENEGFVRLCVVGFIAAYNPTMEEIGDIKTAVSEAVTNSIVHAYPSSAGDVEINVKISNSEVYITVTDFGIGIDNIEKAKQPFYTSKPDMERSGMGFTVMEGFMDNLTIKSQKNKGVQIVMTKKLGDYSIAVGG